MRRLVVDCQILQTPAYDRGMGKYTLSLLAAFLTANKIKPYYGKLQLVFSNNLEKSEERINAIQKHLVGVENIFLDLPVDISTELHAKYDEAQSTLTKFIEDTNDKEQQTDFLIMAPFFVGFPATFPSNDSVRKFSIVYDLIPQKIWHLQQIFPDDIYFNHYKLFLKADHLFTISTAVKDDLVKLVGLSEEKITSIDGGPFMRSAGAISKSTWKPEHEPYVLMPSAPIVHKNNERAVQGFARFNKAQDNRYTLYVTSNFDDVTKDKLIRICPDIVFTGNISDERLAEAYKQADAVLFPSLTEGLGMPVLEAAQYNVPVACSDIPVLSELSNTAFYQFDPNDIQDIAETLGMAVQKQAWQSHEQAYTKLKVNYTWERSSEYLLRGIAATRIHQAPHVKKLELVLPRPNHDTAAGCLGELLYATLAERYRVALRFSTDEVTNRASYVAYLDQEDTNDPTLIITNKRRRLVDHRLKRFPVSIRNSGMQPTNQLTIYAKRAFKDKALKLAGWEYTDSKGIALSPKNLVDLILSKGAESK